MTNFSVRIKIVGDALRNIQGSRRANYDIPKDLTAIGLRHARSVGKITATSYPLSRDRPPLPNPSYRRSGPPVTMTLAHQILPLGSTFAVLPSGVSLVRVAILLPWSGLSHRTAVLWEVVTCTSTGRPNRCLIFGRHGKIPQFGSLHKSRTGYVFRLGLELEEIGP